MSTPESITERLNAEADEELKRRLKEARIAFLAAIQSTGCGDWMDVEIVHWEDYKLGEPHPPGELRKRVVSSVPLKDVFIWITEAITNKATPGMRKAKIDAFMARIEELVASGDEIRQQIGN